MTRRASGAALIAALAVLALPGQAGAVGEERQAAGRSAYDAGSAQSRPVAERTRRARRALGRRLGRQGFVETDARTGGVRNVARLDGFLTAPRSGDPARIVLDYVRANEDVFGLSEADLDGLRLVRRYRSANGVTHLTWAQTHQGIPALNAHLRAAVTNAGRLLTVQGGARGGLRVASTTPELSAREALAAALRDAGSTRTARRASTAGRGAQRITRFPGGHDAELVLFDAPRSTTLAWRLTVHAARNEIYDYVVDASEGRVLRRENMIRRANQALAFERHPGAPHGGTAALRDLSPWLAPGATILQGPNATAFADLNDNDVADPGEHVGPRAGGDWDHPFTPVASTFGACPVAGCSWSHLSANSWQANVAQSTTQAFWYVNTFHDHLRDAPIGFTPAAGAFEGADALEVNTNDGAATAGGLPDDAHRNNANMWTPPDGQSPRMQMYLFGGAPFADVNGADDASIVYHEYTHGLVGRTVTDPGGRSAMRHVQSSAMDEGFADWYAMDYLVGRNLVDDTGADGEVFIGDYVDGGRGVLRTEALDCAVGAPSTACPGVAGAGPGGYTYDDYGRVDDGGPEPHADGEIWAQTLWDLRSRLVADHGAVAGVSRARSLVTEGMRLAPVNPSFLDMRNAILAADTVAGGADRDAIWAVFARRGMGWYASAIDGDDRQPIASFARPPAGGGPTATLRGTVTGRDGGAPVTGARVYLGGHFSSLAGDLEDTTDGTGQFEITGVPTGTYPHLVFAATGHARHVQRQVTVSGPVTTADQQLRRNWADLGAGAALNPAPAPAECGAADAFDGLHTTAWSAPASSGPVGVTLQLPAAMDITGFGVDPGAGCGDDDTASAKSLTIYTAADGQGWKTAAEPTFEPGDNHQLNTVEAADDAKTGVRYVHVVINAPQGPSGRQHGTSHQQWMDLSEFQVYATRNGRPQAAFTVAPETPETDETVTFDASASTDADGTIERHQWDLDGDGSYELDTGAAATADRVYDKPGMVTARLRVTDDAGDTAVTAQTFEVVSGVTITDLGTLPGDVAAYAGDINRRNVVVGNSDGPGGTMRAFMRTSAGMIELPGLGGPASAFNVNNEGQAVGWSDNPSIAGSSYRAVRWTNGVPTDLGTLGGNDAIARGINAAGEVVGQAEKTVGEEPNEREVFRAFLHTGGMMSDLGSLAGDTGESAAYDINALGQVVGWSETAAGTEHAFLATTSGMADLGTLGGPNSQANAINDFGQVVGVADTSGGTQRPFLYSNGRMRSLGSLGGNAGSALDVNQEGEVVGYSQGADGQYRAFAYRDGEMTDLNTLLPKDSGWTRLTAAFAINNARRIVGYGVKGGQERPFLLDLGDCEICVEEIRVQERDVPSGAWQSAGEDGIVDGNLVRVVATIQNHGSEPQLTQVKFLDGESGEEHPDTREAEALDPGEQAEVTAEIDTEGMAWGDGGTPRTHRFFRVQLDVGESVFDTETERVAIQPKPAVLVHGWNSSADTWATYGEILETAHPSWKGHAVGDGSAPGTMNTDPRTGNSIEQNAQILADYVAGVRAKHDAEQVEIVAHSMGGLISRRYIHALMGRTAGDDPHVDHLVMLGTPNQGSPCAELILAALSGAGDPSPAVPTIELTPVSARVFNHFYTQTRGVQFSIVAGDSVPRTCQDPERGDLVVALSSAKHTFTDYGTFPILHMGMTASQELFDFWVKPHLVPGAPQPAAPAGRRAGRTSAADRGATADPGPQVIGTEVAGVPAGGTVEVPLAVPAGTRLGVVHVAPATVGSELVDPDGTVRASIAADSGDASAPVRLLEAAAPTAGTWKLRLTATAGAATVPVSAWVEGSALAMKLDVGAPNAGRLALSAQVADGATPVTGATVKAVLRRAGAGELTVSLHDDGAHGDGAAGDGRYGATAGVLTPGPYSVIATATGSHDGSAFRRTTLGSADVPQPSGGGDPDPGGGGDPGDGGGSGGGSGGGGSGSGGGGSGSGGGGGGTPVAPAPAAGGTAPPTPAPPGERPASPRVTFRGRTLTVTKGRVGVRVACPQRAGTCAGTLRLQTAKAVRRGRKKQRLTLGTARFSVRAGRTATVTVRLSAAGRRLIKPGRSLAAVATAVTRDAARKSVTATARVVLKAPKRGRRR